MMKSTLVFLKVALIPALMGIASISIAQPLTTHRTEIDSATKILTPAFKAYGECILTQDLDHCSAELLKKATDPYSQYVIGGLMYQVDTGLAFDLHRKAYLAQPDDENFILEYAIALHRRGQYGEAAKLYERYVGGHADDFPLHVWLADCYINMGKTTEAITEWGKANHAQNHSGIDQAINTIYGKTDQLRRRNTLRNDLSQGKTSAASALIFLDANWVIDPWNTVVEEDMLQTDIALVKKKIDTASFTYKTLKAYIAVKALSEGKPDADSIRIVLKANNLLLDGKPLPDNGSIASNLVQICLRAGLIEEKDFLKKRGEEILRLAKTNRDPELLNIYAYLQTAGIKDNVNPEIDKYGWKEFKEERFAVSYFIGKGDKNRNDDPELAQALIDFPSSAMLYWIKINLVRMDKKPIKAMLPDMIKKEFKTLGSDPSHYSYALNSYFGYLTTEK